MQALLSAQSTLHPQLYPYIIPQKPHHRYFRSRRVYISSLNVDPPILASAAHCAIKAMIQAGIAIVKVARKIGWWRTCPIFKPFRDMMYSERTKLNVRICQHKTVTAYFLSTIQCNVNAVESARGYTSVLAVSREGKCAWFKANQCRPAAKVESATLGSDQGCHSTMCCPGAGGGEVADTPSRGSDTGGARCRVKAALGGSHTRSTS